MPINTPILVNPPPADHHRIPLYRGTADRAAFRTGQGWQGGVLILHGQTFKGMMIARRVGMLSLPSLTKKIGFISSVSSVDTTIES